MEMLCLEMPQLRHLVLGANLPDGVGVSGVSAAQLWPFRVSPTLPLCLYFVSLTYLATIWKSTFSFLCYFLNVLTQVLGPVFSWQTEHPDAQADQVALGAPVVLGAVSSWAGAGDDLVCDKFSAGGPVGPRAQLFPTRELSSYLSANSASTAMHVTQPRLS